MPFQAVLLWEVELVDIRQRVGVGRADRVEDINRRHDPLETSLPLQALCLFGFRNFPTMHQQLQFQSPFDRTAY